MPFERLPFLLVRVVSKLPVGAKVENRSEEKRADKLDAFCKAQQHPSVDCETGVTARDVNGEVQEASCDIPTGGLLAISKRAAPIRFYRSQSRGAVVEPGL